MGLFIVFEGVEGSGKSTQSRELVARLQTEGLPARLIREPGGTPIGEQIRGLLQGDYDITPLAELLLFNAARASLVETVLRPALDDGEVVVCDRYVYSTLAYQGYGRGLDIETIRELDQIATGGLDADLVVLLDLPTEDGISRKGDAALDRIEREGRKFHERVRKGYLDIARQQPERWLVLDSSKSINTLAESIWSKVSILLSDRPD